MNNVYMYIKPNNQTLFPWFYPPQLNSKNRRKQTPERDKLSEIIRLFPQEIIAKNYRMQLLMYVY